MREMRENMYCAEIFYVYTSRNRHVSVGPLRWKKNTNNLAKNQRGWI